MGGGICAGIGWLAGWLEFRALGMMAAVVLLVAGFMILRRTEHDVLLELHRPRVQVGEEALGRVVVTSSEGKRSGPTTMEFHVGKATAQFRVSALGPGDEHEEMFAIPTRRRGVIQVGPVLSIQADPVGAISRQKKLSDSCEFYIHPRITPVQGGSIGFLKDVEGITTTNLSSSDVSFHALREYQPGDDRRAVHWKTTARTGTLMVRQFEETMRAHMVIMLSTKAQNYATPDDFELAVSTAGSLAVSALRDERQVSVLTSAGEVLFPNAIGLLDRLSAVELQEEGAETRALAVLANAIPGISVGAFVTGTVPHADLRAAQLALHRNVYAFAVRCGENLTMARSKVGDLTVLDITTLPELPAAMRSLR